MPEVKQLPEMKLVGIRVLCPGDQYIIEIPKASKRLSERIDEIANVVNPALQYGAFVVEHSSNEEDGYWVCVEVTEFGGIPDDMVALTIPAQMYAVSRHIGANDKIRQAYNELHQWIEANGYQRLTAKWHLEAFHEWSDPANIDVELLDTVAFEV
ncbi:AraC family transcriptional regulator [Mesobacillus boroniphilus]|uniref:AraC family transcriptional regulator n=1 Tax=Mesobacillus boroniphilus TaxID=308892 RepID=A0A944GVM9_9BACI|nr:GyrI-like domain-containing protein [Mesobacillus boroniphilus]MBS8263679.1 AraC family transcriptional regulator [Mesobacillus boroniphilus]